MYFTVMGGDKRLAHLAELLAEEGRHVDAFGLDKADVRGVGRLAAPCCGDVTILPLPASYDCVTLNAPHAVRGIYLREVWDAIQPGTFLFAGKLTPEQRAEAEKRGAKVCDYFLREEFTVANANATAEGTIGILTTERGRLITGANVLIIGFGRIGKLLAAKLRALGANVTVSARKASDRAWITAMGMTAEDTGRLTAMETYDTVINTVPAPVLDGRLLSGMRSDCFVLDLASAPGGVDMTAAEKAGVTVRLAPGLPGKFFPDDCGRMILDTIYNVLNEVECTI